MNLSSVNTCFSNSQNCIQSLLLRCCGSCVRRGQVHPEIFIPKDLEFVNLGSQRVIRVLHLPPQQAVEGVATNTRCSTNRTQNDEMRHILEVEDYWFTRSNRPFKAGDGCDCISGSLSAQKSPEVRNNLTNYFSGKAMKSEGNTSSKDSNVKEADHMLLKYAENIMRVILDEAYGVVLSQQKNIGLAVETANFIPKKLDWCRGSANGDAVSRNIYADSVPQVEKVTQAHHGDIDNSEDVHTLQRVNYDSGIFVKTTTRSSSDGIVNLSFSGTFSEPDDLTSHIIIENQSVPSSSSQLLAVSGNYDERSKFSLDGAHMNSEVNKNLEKNISKILVTEESEDLPNLIDQRIEKDFTVEFSSNEDRANVMDSKLVEQVECSKENIDAKVYFDDIIKKINERKVEMDRCWHSKTTQKPSLLFLHGAGSSADIWSLQLQYFSLIGYEVLAPDMLGHGYSSAPDSPSAYSFHKLLEDILQIFDKFILEHQKCVIIGHSYGSSLAAAVSRYRPQQVVQLVLLSSGGPSPLVPNEAFFPFPSCIMSLMRPFLMCGFKRDLFYGPRGKHLHPCCTYELPPYVLKHVERGQEWTEGDAAFHRRITVPTLLVHGLKDPYISLVEECEMERTIPRSFLEVISNAGHMIMLDTPEQLCHMIHSFITWWNL